jgi:hypothetical protein
MDEPIVSEFYTFYYFKSIFGAIAFLLVNLYFGCMALSGGSTGSGYGYFVLSLLFPGAYFYVFSKSWKRTTVTPTEILIDYWVLKKQQRIPYTDIKSINTYRMAGSNTSIFGRYGQSFVMEFNNGKSVSFSESYYNNYSKLTMAIYLHKYGSGHGRERYLERHGG